MIGKIVTGKSFRGCLLYCLHDKGQRENQSSNTAMKDRAEVLLYNKCYGSDKELIRQFGEVRVLNPKVTKPVLHITLSLPPGEQLGRDKWMEIAGECASDMGFLRNQYIAVSHKDTGHPHLHIVANRIGFDGRTVADSNSYKRMALFCRKMEQKYDLKQVLSPRRYLSREQRQLPRLDQRKERIKGHLQQGLASSKSYDQFESKMKGLGYQLIRGRGLSFLDDKGVKVKGSEVGYSLQRIEQTLAQKAGMQPVNKTLQREGSGSERKGYLQLLNRRNPQAQIPGALQGKEPQNSLSKTVDVLLQPAKAVEAVDQQLLKKKREKEKRSLHL